MQEQGMPPADEPAQPEGEAGRALVLRPEATLVTEPVAPPARLPALVGRYLPVLWDGGRGPLARALVAGGLLALGSVVGRMAAGPSSALVPLGKARPAAPPAARPRRVEVTIETEIGARAEHGWGRATTHWGRRRVRIVQEWAE
jgi:hypothetical protein